MQLLLKICMPEKGTREPPGKEYKGPPIEDEVRQMLEKVDSYHDSDVEWKALKRFYTDMCRMKQSPRVRNLRKMIKPVLAKYGYPVE